MSVGDVFGVHAPFWEIVYRTAIVYVAIVVGIRLTGRRQLGQMTPFELVLILLIANAVQNAMVGTDASIFGGLVAAFTLLVLNRALVFATDWVRPVRKALEGEPVLLVNDGKFIKRAIAHAGLTEDLVLQAVREHGIEDVSQVHIAVLEIDGTVSVVPTGTKTIRSRHRVRAVHPGGGP